jgi:hypothetical protein
VQLIKLPNGTVMGLIRQSDGGNTPVSVPAAAGTPTGKRKSWREINVQ